MKEIRLKAIYFHILFVSWLLVISTSITTYAQDITTDTYDGRSMFVYVPPQLPSVGTRALVIVLHGGMGNAQRIVSSESESGLNMNAAAQANGFVVAYLNGTPVTRFLGADKLGWNAGGGCCGQSARNNIDDDSYIKGAAYYLADKYGIDRARIYAIGHSNGAMMAERLLCETDLLAAAISVSGTLNVDAQTCPAARGKRLLALHGADDENVPLTGGKGSKGLSGVAYNSEEHAREVFTASGANYSLIVLSGTDHKLDHIDAAMVQTEHQTIAQKAAQFFGLSAARSEQ